MLERGGKLCNKDTVREATESAPEKVKCGAGSWRRCESEAAMEAWKSIPGTGTDMCKHTSKGWGGRKQ